MRRMMCSVGRSQSNARSGCRIAGRIMVPGTSVGMVSIGTGRNAGSAALTRTSCMHSMAASATGPLYSADLRGGAAGSENVRVAQIGPASISSTACRAVTPQVRAPSVIAQSSDDGPRSPTGPGWMITVRQCCQISAGTRSFRNGQRIRSGRVARTLSIISSAVVASSTPTS
jgi:hypothetical protein